MKAKKPKFRVGQVAAVKSCGALGTTVKRERRENEGRIWDVYGVEFHFIAVYGAPTGGSGVTNYHEDDLRSLTAKEKGRLP